MGTKLQPQIRARNKLKRGIHPKTCIVLVKVRVGLKEARWLVGPRDLQMMIQMIIWIQEDQMLEEMLIDLAEIMNATRRQQLRNLTEVLEESLLVWLNGER